MQHLSKPKPDNRNGHLTLDFRPPGNTPGNRRAAQKEPKYITFEGNPVPPYRHLAHESAAAFHPHDHGPPNHEHDGNEAARDDQEHDVGLRCRITTKAVVEIHPEDAVDVGGKRWEEMGQDVSVGSFDPCTPVRTP